MNTDRKQIQTLGWHSETGSSINAIDELQKEAHRIAVEKGWWDDDREAPECIAAIHSEMSEAFAAYRDGNPMSNKIPPFSQIEEELADVIIRVLDYAERNSFEIGKALAAKMAYNEGREYRHGGKLA